MLVFQRRPGESVIIDSGPNRIRVKIVEITGDTRPTVRLAFDAPSSVVIDREETREARDEQDKRQREAKTAVKADLEERRDALRH